MKKKYILITFLLVIIIPIITFAHKGRTDSSGGHYDYSAKEYHYHHGYSAHQHPNGVCPYETTTSTNILEETSTSTSEETPTTFSNDNNIQDLQENIKRLEDQISYKQQTIGSLNKEIEEYKKKLEEKSSCSHYITFLFISISIILLYIIYSLNKNLKQKNKRN